MKEELIKPENLLLIKDIPGYTPHISRLLCMMNYARSATIASVKDLTVKELDYQLDEKSNSIGALLLHMASVEFYYQKCSFEERDLTDEEYKIWLTALDLGEKGRNEIKGNDLDYYLNKLNNIREETYKLLKDKDDAWLHKESEFWGQKGNNYFMWFHTFEDEINHRGQISLIKKRIKIQ